MIVCENNLFAQSTCQVQTLAGDICACAAAFGVDTAHGNTWEWPELFGQMRESIERVRTTGRPLFHRVDTFRLMAHSKGDDNRPADYIQSHRERDPLDSLSRRFAADPRWQQMVSEIDQRVKNAADRADAASFGTIDLPAPSADPHVIDWKRLSFTKERVVQSVKRGLHEGLVQYPDVVILGEDVESPYGGAFKCTMGLSQDFEGRVRNMPISELAMLGVGNGLALAGMRPVIEMMFGDFLALAADQWINHAAKFRFMFNDKVSVPLIVRTPMGGKRGYAATHSQSLEKHLLGLPGTRVLCLHHRCNPADLYRTLFAANDLPTLVVENKILYGQTCSSDAPPGFELIASTGHAFPTVRLKPAIEPEVTILAVGGMSLDAENAVTRLFEEDEIAADLFLPTQLYPFDIDVLAESLEQTRRLVVVEEGQGFVSLGGEIVAQVTERFGRLNVACRRLAAAPVPIPAARPLEQLCLPNADSIIARVKEVARELVH